MEFKVGDTVLFKFINLVTTVTAIRSAGGTYNYQISLPVVGLNGEPRPPCFHWTTAAELSLVH